MSKALQGRATTSALTAAAKYALSFPIASSAFAPSRGCASSSRSFHTCHTSTTARVTRTFSFSSSSSFPRRPSYISRSSPLSSASLASPTPSFSSLPSVVLGLPSRRFYCSSDSNSSNSSNNSNTCGSSHPNPPPQSHHLSSTFSPQPTISSESPVMPDEEISRYLRQSHARVFEHNRAWVAEQTRKDPNFFVKLAAGQKPEYLWIGCSDSRIPAEQIAGLQPGEAFIHRNIANLVNNVDLNVMSVIQYAVRHLEVKHIIVCGHYGCGGVTAAMTPQDLGILNPWLRNIRDVYRQHSAELDAIEDKTARCNRLVELNVIEQCRNVIKSAAVQQSYSKKKYPIVHGWVFGLDNGLLKDLHIGFEDMLSEIQKIYNLDAY